MSADRLAAMEISAGVVDAGSFSAAASQLGAGQPAVSKAVAQLEERLGVRLLLEVDAPARRRRTREDLLREREAGDEHVNHAEQAARGDAGLSSTLRVSASVCFSRIHLLPQLPES